MPETLEKVDDTASVADLEKTFRRFRRRTAALRNTYVELRDEAERMNEELQQANRRLEEKVRELEEVNSFQNSILASLPVGVIVADLDGVIKRFNPAAEDIWQVDAEEAIGRSVDAVLGGHSQALHGVLSGDVQRQTRQIEAEDKGMVLSSTVNTVRNGQGEAIGVIQLDRDVSRVQRLEDQLSHSENLADLGRSAAGMAHEVRKPLNGIKGFASLLRRVTDGESADKYSSRIMEAAGRLDSMLEDLLDFAQPEDVETGSVDLRRLSRQVADFVEAEDEVEDADVSVEVEVDENARIVAGDADKMEQVLLNLVKNGVEAIETNGRVLIGTERVELSGEPKVQVSVTDDGQGIPEEKQDDIVEPFITDKDGGSGLGLAMVQKILRMHGTEMDIESEPGVGTSMQFYLSVSEKGNHND